MVNESDATQYPPRTNGQTDGRTDGRSDCTPRPAFAFGAAGKNFKFRNTPIKPYTFLKVKCQTFRFSGFFEQKSSFLPVLDMCEIG